MCGGKIVDYSMCPQSKYVRRQAALASEEALAYRDNMPTKKEKKPRPRGQIPEQLHQVCAIHILHAPILGL